MRNEETGTDSASIVMLVLLTIMTFGLFIPFWFLLKRNSFNSMQSGEKIGVSIFVLVLLISVISLVIRGAVLFPSLAWIAEHQVLKTIPKVFDIVAFFVITLQCFKVKRVLNDHFSTFDKWNKPFSDINTFVFQIFYLQYKINKFNEHKRISQTLNEIQNQVIQQ